jgi:2-methylisocitrate lyase-like PEP mutase family enzyme
MFMSQFAVSAARLGLSDTGLISFVEMLDSLRSCCSAARDVPLIGDGDTGYGSALKVQRTVILHVTIQGNWAGMRLDIL